MPLGNHLLGLQKTQDSLQLAILSTEYLCLEKGDQSNIEFSDGSFIYMANMLELNCDGKAFFNLTESDVLQLSSKRISKVVLGSRYEGYTKTTIPAPGEAEEFLTLMNCVSSIPAENLMTFDSIPVSSNIPANSDFSSTETISDVLPSAEVIPSETITTNYTQATIPPLRTVQFIATSGGKTFSELAYLGNLVSEQVGDKNIFRYKIQGNFTDADVQHVIASLAIHGYKGAFEVKN